MLLLSALAVPKIEIGPVFIGVAIAAKGLQHIVGHVCSGSRFGYHYPVPSLCSRYPSSTEPAKEKMSVLQWKATLVKPSMTIIYRADRVCTDTFEDHSHGLS